MRRKPMAKAKLVMPLPMKWPSAMQYIRQFERVNNLKPADYANEERLKRGN